MAAARGLLGPDQLRLPEKLESIVKAAVAAWDDGQYDEAANRLGKALRLAERLNFA